MDDLRFALRQLVKAPGFTAMAVSTLGLGIGACAAIFSVVNPVLLRPPPFPQPDRVVVLRETSPAQGQRLPLAPGRYLDWRGQATSFAAMGALGRVSYNLTGAGDPVHLWAARIGVSALDLLAVNPILGRRFLPGEEVEGGRENVALLGHGLWRERFGGRADVLGQTIQLDGRPVTVVGVLPRDSGLPEHVELYTPLGFSENERQRRDGHWLEVFARLRPGVTPAQAQAEMAAIADGERPGWGVAVAPLVESRVGEVRPVLLALVGAVGFLLLLACANVANLLLARATTRAKEMAVRAALGASRGRIVRQLLIESVLLALVGGALGVALAPLALEALLVLPPESLPRAAEIAIDARALGFTVGLALLTGVGFGLAPALHATGAQVQETLKRSARAAGGGGQRLRGALVVCQVAIALVLLIGAGLLARSFARLQAVDPGFNPRDALIAEVYLPRSRYPEPAQQSAFAEQALARLAALPGVAAAGAGTNLPLTGPAATRALGVSGRAPTATPPLAGRHLVSPDFFRAMGIPLLRGRPFDARDGDQAPRVAVVSQSVARRLFPGEEAVGQRLELGAPNPRLVVGVVADVKAGALDQGAGALQIYEPLAQNPDRGFTFVVRASGPGLERGLLPAVRDVIARLDPEHPTNGMRPLRELVGDSIARQRFAATLFAAFSGVALLLAAIGLYGVLGYTVLQRTQEIGVRMALGAQAADVLGLVVRQAGKLVAAGLAAGLAGAGLLTGFLRPMLFGVGAHDPLTFAALAAGLAAVGAVACLVPARRAARVDPMVALRSE